MSSEGNGSPSDLNRNRQGSVTSAALSSLFRSNSTTTGPNVTAAMARDQRRRLSVTTLGLSGTAPGPITSTPLGGLRRGSISTINSDLIDENAVDDDGDSARNTPATPFARRMSFGAQAMRSMRQPGVASGNSPGEPNPSRNAMDGNASTVADYPISVPSKARRSSISQASTAISSRTPSNTFLPVARQDQVYNWSEQLRSRAESSVSGMRPSLGAGGMSVSPPRGTVHHDRTKSVSDMPVPPQQAAAVQPKPDPRPKPDYMQERILKGDFYMD